MASIIFSMEKTNANAIITSAWFFSLAVNQLKSQEPMNKNA